MDTHLREIEVPIESLYLDPNNPRFADLQDRLQPVPQDRIAEAGVQERALKRILDERFEVKQLKDSIRTSGFSRSTGWLLLRYLKTGSPP